MSDYPSKLRVGETRLLLRADCYALLGEPGSGQVQVIYGEPPAGSPTVGVYSPAGSPTWAVPTGRLFVRVAQGKRISAHRDAIEAAGFGIEKIPDFAPHSARVVALSGNPADALSRIERLTAVPGIVHVEPELLRARSAR
jgi:hypothetical protein